MGEGEGQTQVLEAAPSNVYKLLRHDDGDSYEHATMNYVVQNDSSDIYIYIYIYI